MSILRLSKQLLALAISINLLGLNTAHAMSVKAPVVTGAGASGGFSAAAAGGLTRIGTIDLAAPGAGLSLVTLPTVAAPSLVTPDVFRGQAHVGASAAQAPINGLSNAAQISPNGTQWEAAAGNEFSGRQSAGQAAGSAVERHPVLGIINDLQKAGVNVSEMPRTAEDAAALAAAIEKNVPAGKAKREMMAFANAVAMANGASASNGTSRIFDNVAAPYRDASLQPKAELEVAEPAVSGWTKFWAGRSSSWFGLKASAEKTVKESKAAAREAARAQAKTIDTSKLTTPENKLAYQPDEAALPASTQEVPLTRHEVFGQERAMASLRYAIAKDGENVIVTGADGTGRTTGVRQLTAEIAPTKPTPRDLVAVTNLADKDFPIVLELATGNGTAFREILKKVLVTLKKALPQMLGDGPLAEKKEALHKEWEEANAAAMKQANARLSQVRSGRFGLALVPSNDHGTRVNVILTVDGVIRSPQDVEAMIAAEASSDRADKVTLESLNAAKEAMGPGLQAAMKEISGVLQEVGQAHGQVHQQMDQLDQQAVVGVVNQLGQALFATTEDPAYTEFRARVQQRKAALDAEIGKVKILKVFGLAINETEEGLRAMPTFMDPRAAQLGQMAAMLGIDPVIPIGSAEELEALREAYGDAIPASVTWEQLKKATFEKAKLFEGAFVKLGEENQKDHESLPEPSMASRKAAAYVKALLTHIVQNYEDFLPAEAPEGMNPMMAQLMMAQREDAVDNYKASVLATNKPNSGAPVVFEHIPTFKRVFGTAEDAKSIMMVPGAGAVKKDAPGGPKLQSGALIRANGGYLVLDLMDVLRENGVYQGLMRMVRNGTAEIGEDGVMSLYMDRGHYDVPVSVKVIFLGSPYLKMMLRHYDEDFSRLFKAAAEFENAMAVSAEAIEGYLKVMRIIIEEAGGKMLHFARSGIAALLQVAARGADSNEELTAQFGPLKEVMSEASYWAEERLKSDASSEKLVTRADVEKAASERSMREASMRNRYYDLYQEGSFKLDVEGSKVGAITGMAVMGEFGIPAKITVVNSLKGGEALVVSTEKNASLTGSSFEQSLGNITGFFEQLFGEMTSFPLKARVKFEQNYGGIDGDSATQTMIYAILSRWSGVPIKQGIAITGSADQEGNVQVIGGLKHKIEGFWDVATAKFKQDHGREPTPADGLAIIYPADNMRNLALRPDVAQAVRDGRLKLHPVVHISQGVELLTGVPYAVVLDKVRENAGKAKLAAVAEMKALKGE